MNEKQLETSLDIYNYLENLYTANEFDKLKNMFQRLENKGNIGLEIISEFLSEHKIYNLITRFFNVETIKKFKDKIFWAYAVYYVKELTNDDFDRVMKSDSDYLKKEYLSQHLTSLTLNDEQFDILCEFVTKDAMESWDFQLLSTIGQMANGNRFEKVEEKLIEVLETKPREYHILISWVAKFPNANKKIFDTILHYIDITPISKPTHISWIISFAELADEETRKEIRKIVIKHNHLDLIYCWAKTFNDYDFDYFKNKALEEDKKAKKIEEAKEELDDTDIDDLIDQL